MENRSRKGIYSIVSTYVLIIIVVVCIMMVFFLNNTLLKYKDAQSQALVERSEFRHIRDRMFHCFGTVLDPSLLVQNISCIGLQGDQGISVRRIPYSDCPTSPVRELNFRGFGRVEHYHVSMFGHNQSTVCPAVLSIYEHAVVVPLILNASVSPLISVKPSPFTASVSYFQTKDPSYLNISIRNAGIVRQNLGSGPLLHSASPFITSINSALLDPGLYLVSVIATHDREFFDTTDDIARFRVVDPLDAPIINSVTVTPRSGSIYDYYTVQVNISDYLALASVNVDILEAGVVVSTFPLAEISSNFDKNELVYNYVYRGAWDASSMPNENRTYDVRVTATNSLGNPSIAAGGSINTSQLLSLVLIVTNSRVASAYPADISAYRAALTTDGYGSILLRLDTNDVQLCDAALSPAAGPTIEQDDALVLIPQCITKYDAKYVLILGGHAQVEQYLGGKYDQWDYYTDDYYADTIGGDGRPDVPIGRIPDGNPPGDDTVQKGLITATGMHVSRGWAAGGTHYSWNLDVPYGHKSPNVIALECSNRAASPEDEQTCGADSHCYFAPPHSSSGGRTPPDWALRTDLVYICGHGNEFGLQTIHDHGGGRMGDASTIAGRDFTGTVLFYNPCFGGKIDNRRLDESSIMQGFQKGVVAIFAGTTPQTFMPNNGACSSFPVTNGVGTGTTYLANLAYEINRESPKTLGDAWQKQHNLCPDKVQREHNVMYGDPSIRVK